jgi:hypothetical protein
MPKRSLFNQLNQVRGTRDFEDLTSYNELAETCGRSYQSGTLAVVSGSATVTDSSNAFDRKEQNNYIVITDGDAAGVYQITASGTTGNFNAGVTPTPTATDATASYRRHYYQNLEDDLNYLRTMMDMVIGENNWYDDPDTDLKNMAYLVPKRPNYVGETGQYTDRPGTVSFSISDIDQTGYVSSGSPAGEYTDNTSNTSAGSSIRFTDDNTMVISITGGFYPADTGTINITRDGAVVGTLDLAAAWTADNCSYEETEDDVGDNPGHTATGAGTDIISLTNRRCMNTTTDSYPSFWPPYQIASMSATLTLPAGYQGQIAVAHTSGGSQNYSYTEFWVDTTSQSISATAPTVAVGSTVSKYLSGVPYFTTNSTFTVSGTNSDTLFDRGYVTNPMTLNVSQFNASNVTPSLAQIGFSTPLAITDTIAGSSGYGTTITVGGGNFRDLDARATATYRNVFTSSNSSNSAAGTYRIDTYGQTSTDTVEYFDDEVYRMLGTEDFTDTGVDEGDSSFSSSTSILSQTDGNGDEGLVVYNGTLKYPTIDHSSGFYPAGPDYSGQTGDFVYYRVFLATGAFTTGTITFSGWSNALSTIQGSNVEVHLRYPNCTDYGNNNTSVWQDLGTDQTTYGGNGCLGTGSSGSSVAFSFGTTSSNSYGNRIIMRIKYKASSVTALTGITFSPTL